MADKINSDSIKELQALVVKFRDERDWKQFHSAKNIASALNVEAAELLEHYLWTEDPRWPEKVGEEASDILYHLLLFCEEAEIDLGKAFVKKLEKNRKKYPVEKAKGSPKKYTDL
jgi:NTP pyrophosphatase (non-canonical NTP hydrolase)